MLTAALRKFTNTCMYKERKIFRFSWVSQSVLMKAPALKVIQVIQVIPDYLYRS
jgi:hypothetical protein